MTRRGRSIAERLIQTVATETDTDPLDLPPLYETVDPDALDTCIQTLSDGECAFQYAGCAITVESDGQIRVDENRLISGHSDESATCD